MPEKTLAKYAFVPWLRRGIATEITDPDDLGNGHATTLERAQLSVSLQLEATPTQDATLPPIDPITKEVSLLGPGDINGIQSQAIIRHQPHTGATNFEANGLAYVDFYEEDFPWRYTPARPARDMEPAARFHKLRPWFALIVLQDDEFELAPEVSDQPPAIILNDTSISDTLPLHTESWAWAHVQISKEVKNTAEVDGAIQANPDHALSRIICPRRLTPEKGYHAFIIPNFETGRLAGLGEPTSGIGAQEPAWLSGAMPHSTTRPYTYPVYLKWQFRTGENGDFESLVRALVPGPVGPEFGKRDADVRTPGFGLDSVPGPEQVAIEGALRPPEFSPEVFPSSPGRARVNQLEKLLDITGDLEQGEAITIGHPFNRSDGADAYPAGLPDDPIVTPPAYGRRHADVERMADARGHSSLTWLRELNLDFRNRAAAGLGVEVVQKRQEELMERAWEQVGELDLANQRLREAELAVAVSESLFGKHLAAADSDRAVRLTAAAQRRILGSESSTTIHSEIVASQVPQAAQSAAFKRASRPQRKLVRSMTGSGNQQGLHHHLLERFNAAESALSSAPQRTEPDIALALASVTDAVAASVTEYDTEGNKPGHILLQLLTQELSQRLRDSVDLDTFSLAILRANLQTALDARIAPTATGDDRDRREQIELAIGAITALGSTSNETAEVQIQPPVFDDTYGDDIAGKSYSGVTVTRTGGTGGGEVARMTAANELAEYQSQLGGFSSLISGRVEPDAPSPLSAVSVLAGTLKTSMRPRLAMSSRVISALRGVTLLAEDQPRRMRPVMAHPTFPDAMFNDLRQRSQDFVIPNYSDLPENTLTLLESNRRFIESYLAGLNEEMARELLWREFPTDQRGTSFQTFWDARDSILETPPADIRKMHQWSGTLGTQSEQGSGYLVLVIRGELFKKYPNTVVYAQKAVFSAGGQNEPRELSDDSDTDNLLFPAFRGELDPDIAFFGFPLTKEEARGDRAGSKPGWFFVLMERPGEINFGLDEPQGPLPPLASWNDLNWGHLDFPVEASSHIAIDSSGLTLDGSGGVEDPTAALWNKSSADLAYILFQNPVLYARHAEELLP